MIENSDTMTPERVKAIRAKEGLSQSQFAKELGISATALQKWERGTPAPSGIAIYALRYIERHGLDAFLLRSPADKTTTR